MKKIFYTAAIAAILTACNAVDPFEVVNPNLSESSLKGQPNSSSIWLKGIERQMAIAMNGVSVIAEITSDNYQNTNTFFNQFLDRLDINFTDNSMNVAFRGIGRLRENAVYGLNEIGPADPNYTDAIRAEYLFYEGISYLLAAEYFKGVPIVSRGPIVERAELLNLAIDRFTQSYDLDQNTAALLARARAQYRAGNKASAVADANAAITAAPSFVKYVTFDPVNSLGNANGFNYTKNELQLALNERGNFDDLQPLPSLDFLDPKQAFISASEDSKIALLKIEEAHLIIAEAQLSDNNLAGAQATMKNIIGLVASRPTRTFSDATEDRTQRAPRSRPDSTHVVVDGRPGLVLYRKGDPITVPILSGTSLTNVDIDALGNSDDALRTLYLMRQEIFIAEGRRITDMGLTWVVSEIEALQNSNLGAGHPSTLPDIPPFLNSIKTEIDAFTYDAATGVVSITHDINQIIVNNKATAYVCPFH